MNENTHGKLKASASDKACGSGDRRQGSRIDGASLLRKLEAASKAGPGDDRETLIGRVGFGLESRVLARIRDERRLEARPPLVAAARRLVPAFAAVTLVAGVWSQWPALSRSGGGTEQSVMQMMLGSPSSALWFSVVFH